MRVLLVTLLLVAPLWSAPPTLEIPAEVRPTGEYAIVSPKTDAVSVVYVGLSGVDAFPSSELKDSRRFLLPVRGLGVGRYKFSAVAAGKDGEQTRADFVVVIGDAPPNPTPVPPGPAPVPPDDAFSTAIKTAYVAETDAQKAVQADALRALYKQAAEDNFLDSCATWSHVRSRMASTEEALKVKGKLTRVQKVINDEIAPKLPTSLTKVDEATKKVGKEQFLRVARILEGLK